jgi:hypothetical protein
VTVCAAAICSNYPVGGGPPIPCLLAIADQTLTAWDEVEYVSGRSKIYFFAPTGAIALVSGNYDAHCDIAAQTHELAIQEGVTGVREIAEIYAHKLRDYRLKRTEECVLAPFGLDFPSFISKQQEMDSEVVQAIISEVGSDDRDIGIDTIIAGIDPTGAHLFRVHDPGTAECCDGSGFVAVGSGGRQFETRYMATSYSPYFPFPEALMLMHEAKKKAEVSVGVGREIDLVCNIQDGRGWIRMGGIGLYRLDAYYKELEETMQQKKAELVLRMQRDADVLTIVDDLPQTQ